MPTSSILRRTTTGDVTTGGTYLRAVILSPGSDAASVTVKAGGSGGTTILTLSAPSSTTGATVSSGNLFGAYCAGGVHVTLSGTGPSVTVIYE